jgi:hypothetical protein
VIAHFRPSRARTTDIESVNSSLTQGLVGPTLGKIKRRFHGVEPIEVSDSCTNPRTMRTRGYQSPRQSPVRRDGQRLRRIQRERWSRIKLPQASVFESDAQVRAQIADSSSINRSQLFIRTHNETLSVVAMRVSNQIVCPLESIADKQPQLQPALGIVDHLPRRFARLKLCAHLL